MSLQSWKVEFYPVEASDVPKEQAVAHSLRKWEGLRKDALEKHGLGTFSGHISEGGRTVFVITANSCALCERYWTNEAGCGSCPLSSARGGYPCDDKHPDEKNAPWWDWSDGDPEPMIAALKQAAEWEAKQK